MAPDGGTVEPVVNAMTIDVEDYFHVSVFDGILPRSAWDTMESRVCRNTERLLDIFSEFEVRATFFVNGNSLAERPDVGRRFVAAGHELGNHTWSHPRMLLQSPSAIRREVEPTDSMIRAVGHTGPIFFRPPYGEHDRQIREIAAARGMSTVLWTVDSRDWALADDPEQIVANVLQQVKPGALILIHERAQTLAVLPDLIRALRETGYTFIPLPEPDPLPRAVASDG